MHTHLSRLSRRAPRQSRDLYRDFKTGDSFLRRFVAGNIDTHDSLFVQVRADDTTQRDQPAGADIEASDNVRIRVGVTLFSTILLCSMVASMHVSTFELGFGTLVFGSTVIVPGEPSIFRVVPVRPSEDFEPLPILGGELVLVDRSGPLTRATLRSDRLETRLHIPLRLASRPQLRVRVVTEYGEDTFVQTLQPARKKAPVSERVHSETLRPIKTNNEQPNLRLYPQSGVWVDGLPNRATAWTSNEGRPLRCSLRNSAFDIHTHTNAQGLVQFRWTPRPQPKGFAFSLQDQHPIEVPIELEQRQLVAEVDSLFVRPGEPLRLTLHSLPTRKPIVVDLWNENRLIQAGSIPIKNHETSITLDVPAHARGFARFDAYRSLFAPEYAATSLSLWISDKDTPDAAADALKFLQTLPGADASLDAAIAQPTETIFAELALSRVFADQIGVSLLRNTVEERKHRVEAKKRGLRKTLNTLFLLTFFLGLVLVAAWAVRYQLRLRKQVRVVSEEGIENAEAINMELIPQLTRFRLLLEVSLVIFGLAVAGYASWTLLQSLRWSY